MKKPLIAFTALSLMVGVSACSMHDNNTPPAQQQNMASRQDWQQQHKEHMRMAAQDLFNAMDTNGDGVVSRKEFSDYSRKWFKEADSGHNNELTFEEFEAQLKKEKMKFMHHHSAGNDGEQTYQNDGGQNYSHSGNDNNDQSDNQPSNRY